MTQTPSGTKALFDLRMQNHRFDVALNNLVQGVCFFDGARRLILANRRFAEIYGLTLDSIQPGTTLKEIVELRHAVNAHPNMTPDEYLLLKIYDSAGDGIARLTARPDAAKCGAVRAGRPGLGR